MMDYLLDTNIIIHWLNNEKNVGQRVRKIIQNPENAIYISSASIWEIAIKKSKKKLKGLENYYEILLKEHFTPLSITPEHAAYVETLPVYNNHTDPFDRILIAQAMVEHMTMITTDTSFDMYGIPVIHP